MPFSPAPYDGHLKTCADRVYLTHIGHCCFGAVPGFRRLFLWVNYAAISLLGFVLMAFGFGLFNLFSGSTGGIAKREIKLISEFVDAVEAGDVRKVTLDGEQVRFRRCDGSELVTDPARRREVTSLLMSRHCRCAPRAPATSGFQTF